MEIHITAEEIINKWIWLKFCEFKNINEYSIKEWKMSLDEKFVLSNDDAKLLWII